MIFISLSLQGFFSCGRTSVSLWTDFSFQHDHSGLLKCCFSAEAACKLFVAAASGSLLLAMLDPSLKPPNIFFPFHLCTRPLHHTTCFRGAGVHLASCLCLFYVWPLGSISSVCRTPVSSVLSVWGEVNHSQWCLGWGLRLAPVALSAPLGLALLHRKPQST